MGNLTSGQSITNENEEGYFGIKCSELKGRGDFVLPFMPKAWKNFFLITC